MLLTLPFKVIDVLDIYPSNVLTLKDIRIRYCNLLELPEDSEEAMDMVQ